jgi:hypothetical protein
MAVFVYSTGSLPTGTAVVGSGATVGVSIDNRTLASQVFRADLWDTSNGNSPKKLLAQEIATIGPNGGVSFQLVTSTTTGATAIEVEIRLPDPHMTANVFSATSGAAAAIPAAKLPILPGEFFQDSDPHGSVL